MWAETHNHAVFTWFPQKMITNETCLTATTAEIEHCTANHDQNLFTPSMTNNFFRKFRTESDWARWRWHPKALRKQVIHTGGSRALKPHKLKIRLNLFRTEKQRIQCSFKQGFIRGLLFPKFPPTLFFLSFFFLSFSYAKLTASRKL